MKYILIILFLVYSWLGFGQEFVVEKVLLTETVDSNSVSEIPRLKDVLDDSNSVVAAINSQILDRFMINSFEQSELEEFRWYDVNCSSEIKEDILYISFSGEYYGAYPNYVSDEMFFDLKTGNPLPNIEIPFHTLFTLPGYLDFLHAYWLEGVKNEFVSAMECAGFEPYCDYYDINYHVDSSRLIVSLTDDCYPHVAQGCSPTFEVSAELDTIKQYLNDIGKYMLLESNYMTMTAIERFLKNKELTGTIPNNVFLFGKIHDRYPFSMALHIDKEQITGLYFYDSQRKKINLKGQDNDYAMFLTETVDNKKTGFFEFDTNVDRQPVEGKWWNAEKTKSLEVRFDKVISAK